MIPAITLGKEGRRRREHERKGKEKRGEEGIIRRQTGNLVKNLIYFCIIDVSWRRKILFPDHGEEKEKICLPGSESAIIKQ